MPDLSNTPEPPEAHSLAGSRPSPRAREEVRVQTTDRSEQVAEQGLNVQRSSMLRLVQCPCLKPLDGLASLCQDVLNSVATLVTSNW